MVASTRGQATLARHRELGRAHLIERQRDPQRKRSGHLRADLTTGVIDCSAMPSPDPVLAALQAAGGEVSRRDVLARPRAEGGFTARELAALPPEKVRDKYATFVDYRLSWALTNLKGEGLVENPRWSVWRLVEPGTAEAQPVSPEAVPTERLAELRAMPYPDCLRTREWRRTRARALERAGNRCILDRAHTAGLGVYHNNYERLGNELASDLAVLCRACHRLYHSANGRPRRPTTQLVTEAKRATASIPPPPPPEATASQPHRPLLQRLLKAVWPHVSRRVPGDVPN